MSKLNIIDKKTAEKLDKSIADFIKKKKVDEIWEGKLTKTEQMDNFGVYLGTSYLVIDDLHKTILARVSKQFGRNVKIVRGVNAKTRRWWDDDPKGPLNLAPPTE